MTHVEAVRPFEPEFAGSAALDHWRGLALGAGLLCAAAVALVVASVPREAAFGRGMVELLVVGAPLVAGFYTLRSGGNRRFGYALIWIGSAWSLTALAESSLSVPYTIGRLAAWSVFPCVVYLLLTFPGDRIAAGLDRALFGATLVIAVLLFYATAPLVQAYPPHTLWATCTTGCPANAVAILSSPPAFLPRLILVREWLLMLLWAGLFWSMLRRYRAASPLRRDALAPVFVAAGVFGVVHITFLAARELGAPTSFLVDLSSAWTLAIVAVCAAFFVGPLRRRLLLGRALAQLWPAVRESSSPRPVRDAVAAALSDPGVELLFRDTDGSWRDERGQERTWPAPLPAGQAATSIGRSADVVMLHDAALLDDQELLDGVSDVVLAGWRHEQLAADLAGAMYDLEGSRRRIAEAADHERARIERDLHDGVQQRLLALGMRLSVAERRFQDHPAAALAEIGDLRSELDRAREELRSVAHGVYPASLTQSGIAASLEELQWHNPLPIHVAGDGAARYRTEVESAVYFTCVEAVQNAMKHAAGATGVWIRLHAGRDALDFEVRDDGAGISPGAAPGRGLRNMRDRIEAIGGRLTVEPAAGGGTRVDGSVPVAAR